MGRADYLITLWALSTVYVGIDTWGHQRYEHQIQTVLVEHSDQLLIYDGLEFNVDLVCCVGIECGERGRVVLMGSCGHSSQCPDLDTLSLWSAVDVKLWMKNDLLV